MQRIANPELRRDILNLLEAKYVDQSRKAELHLTDLIYCLTRSWFDKVKPLPPTEEEVMLFSLGFGLQKVLLDGEAKPVTVDGIVCSPDFIGKRGLMSELKTTRQSIRQKDKATGVYSPSEFSETWVEQIMGYCYAVKQTEYDLAVLHICGDYAPPFPKIAGWRLSFIEEELEEFWHYILCRKAILKIDMELNTIPKPFKYCKEWECNNCRYKVRCESLKFVIELIEEEGSEVVKV